MKHFHVHNAIIRKANEIAKTNFMDYPDYDEDEPITDIAGALTIIFDDTQPHDTELMSDEIYSYFQDLTTNRSLLMLDSVGCILDTSTMLVFPASKGAVGTNLTNFDIDSDDAGVHFNDCTQEWLENLSQTDTKNIVEQTDYNLYEVTICNTVNTLRDIIKLVEPELEQHKFLILTYSEGDAIYQAKNQHFEKTKKGAWHLECNKVEL